MPLLNPNQTKSKFVLTFQLIPEFFENDISLFAAVVTKDLLRLPLNSLIPTQSPTRLFFYRLYPNLILLPP